MKEVGYIHRGYNEKRNFLSLKSSEFSFKKVVDYYKAIDFLKFKLYKKLDYYHHNSFNDKLSINKVDMYHFFNAVNFGKQSWVSTFETTIPRYGAEATKVEKALKALSDDNCKALIALSEFNKKLQLSFVKKTNIHLYNKISDKIQVLYPPQAIVSNGDLSRFDSIEKLKILFVGHDFFRKGGREVFNAIEKLNATGANIELTVVSKMTTDSWITFTNQSDMIEWREKLLSVSFCNYHNSLPNKEVVSLMNSNHVFMVPSLQETFGYVVLEAQACGLPVVTTSIRVFPEINNDECGWLIDVPQTEKGFADVYSDGYEKISVLIQSGIEGVLNELVNDSKGLRLKAESSLERIRKQHNPESHSKALLEIYNKALNK